MLVEKNQLEQAKTHVKALEETWDEAEPSLKLRAAGDWHQADKAIDAVLEALRASPAKKDDCLRKLVELERMIDQMTGK